MKSNKDITEIMLQKLWLIQFLQGLPLLTINNKKLRIFSPGWWNYEKGPDFKNCEIELDEKLLSGDAEIHIASSDWYKHNHNKDPVYNNVILHICWIKDNGATKIFASGNQEIEELMLSKYTPITIIEKLKSNNLKENKSLCSSYFNSIEPVKAKQILEEAALARLKAKSAKIHQKLDQSSWSQLLYENIMRACGYKHTKFLLEELAHLLPLELLNKIALNSPNKSILYLQAALFGCSNLLPAKDKVPYLRDNDTKNYLSALWSAYEKLQELYSLKILTNIPAAPAFSRPTNTPLRRLAAISHLIDKSKQSDLWTSLYSSLKSLANLKNPNISYNKLILLLSKPFKNIYDPYWNTRFIFDIPIFKGAQKLIGKERIYAIILNAFIPLIYAYSEHNKNIALNDLILKLYRNFPAIEDNFITRYMIKRLRLNAQIINERAIYQQGLHGIFELFCNNAYGSCRNCPLTLCFG